MFHSTAPAPDLIECAAPTGAFGPILVGAEAAQVASRLNGEEVEAQHRLSDSFHLDFGDLPSIPAQLDKVISKMWATGWDPNSSNLDLFITDFGLAFFAALRSLPGATPVVRSETDLKHASVWFGEHGAEAFPFHKTFKALVNYEGESLDQMYDAIRSLSDH